MLYLIRNQIESNGWVQRSCILLVFMASSVFFSATSMIGVKENRKAFRLPQAICQFGTCWLDKILSRKDGFACVPEMRVNYNATKSKEPRFIQCILLYCISLCLSIHIFLIYTLAIYRSSSAWYSIIRPDTGQSQTLLKFHSSYEIASAKSPNKNRPR